MENMANDFIILNYLVVLTIWYFLYGTFAYNINYEQTRGGIFLPLYALIDDLSLQIPGRKAELIRRDVEEKLRKGIQGGYMSGGSTADWSYQTVHDKVLYHEVGKAMYPGMMYILIITAPLLYPLYLWIWNNIHFIKLVFP